jgi:hypothetical protein
MKPRPSEGDAQRMLFDGLEDRGAD